MEKMKGYESLEIRIKICGFYLRAKTLIYPVILEKEFISPIL